METDINAIMGALTPYLDLFDGILRHGHSSYEDYPASLVIDHDASTQAHCTNRHVLAEAHRVLDELPGVSHKEIRGQNLWQIDPANVIVRFKKTDEDGVSANFPTRQARAFDRGGQIPGIPAEPTRLTAGYLLDTTGMGYMRSQISLPTRRGVIWCAAIIPAANREAEETAWHEVQRQRRLF